jgi:hypothetical protein
MKHTHYCPECSEHKTCELDCHIEPENLDYASEHKQSPHGPSWVCDPCELRLDLAVDASLDRLERIEAIIAEWRVKLSLLREDGAEGPAVRALRLSVASVATGQEVEE